MPDASEIKKFAKALKTGRTDITRALDALFGHKPDRHLNATDPVILSLVAWLRTPGALATLSPEARTLLGGLKVSPQELDHIDLWDSGQKEDVRLRLVDAIDNNHPYHFFWELHRGNDEETDMPVLPGSGGDIHFRSPRHKMQVPSGWTLGQMRVDVS